MGDGLGPSFEVDVTVAADAVSPNLEECSIFDGREHPMIHRVQVLSRGIDSAIENAQRDKQGCGNDHCRLLANLADEV